MPKPRKNKITGALLVQTKTMFYTEGNPVAVLHTSKAGRDSQSVMEFPSGEAALAWCRQHGANLFYMAVNIVNQ